MPLGRKSRVKGNKRTHNLGGCDNCRRRHVKCDQQRPGCATCRKARLECSGYPSRIRWAANPSLDQSAPSRVQTDDDRHADDEWRVSLDAADSRELQRSTTNLGLDRDDGLISPMSSNATSRQEIPGAGMFGVLDFTIATTASPKEGAQADASTATDVSQQASGLTPPLVEPESSFGNAFDLANVEPFPLSDSMSFQGTDSLGNVGSFLDWRDLFDTGFDSEVPLFDSAATCSGPLRLLAQVADHTARTNDSEDMNSTDARSSVNQSNPSICLTSGHGPDRFEANCLLGILDAAPALLRYFRQRIIPHFGPLPTTKKSPWDIGVYTAAVQALAEMTYLQNVAIKSANRAILFGVLAISAYHDAKSERSALFPSRRDSHRIYQLATAEAKRCLQDSFRMEMSGPTKAKYKDQLMAALTLNAAAAQAGEQQDARCYLIDAERILRLRGLTKINLSRRARLLHHVYTWMRIVGESTFTIHNYSNSSLIAKVERTLHRKRNDSSLVDDRLDSDNRHSAIEHAQLDDFLRVQSYENDSDSDVEVSKDREIGLRDIHLEDMRDDPETMYMEVYGIPETWLSLVSQTTRLANVMDIISESRIQVNHQVSKSLERRAVRLEQTICAFAPGADITDYGAGPELGLSGSNSQSTPGVSTSSSANEAILRAMNSALVIFFYRRIRKVHPLILQSHVTDVVDALKQFDQELDQGELHGPGTPWPAFIAGCEAMSLSNRNWLLAWLEKASKLLSSAGVSAALGVMREVWRHRDEKASAVTGPYHKRRHSLAGRSQIGKSSEHTWVDVLRERNVWLMLY